MASGHARASQGCTVHYTQLLAWLSHTLIPGDYATALGADSRLKDSCTCIHFIATGFRKNFKD